jgi:hypothetical protein
MAGKRAQQTNQGILYGLCGFVHGQAHNTQFGFALNQGNQDLPALSPYYGIDFPVTVTPAFIDDFRALFNTHTIT